MVGVDHSVPIYLMASAQTIASASIPLQSSIPRLNRRVEHQPSPTAKQTDPYEMGARHRVSSADLAHVRTRMVAPVLKAG